MPSFVVESFKLHAGTNAVFAAVGKVITAAGAKGRAVREDWTILKMRSIVSYTSVDLLGGIKYIGRHTLQGKVDVEFLGLSSRQEAQV